MVFSDLESCTRSTSSNPKSMETAEHGLTRWTCLVARCFEIVAVARLLWVSLCVGGMVGFRVLRDFLFSNW